MLLLLSLACAPPLSVSPDSGPQSGYFEITLDTPYDVTAVDVGGIATYELIDGADGPTVHVQGHPESGPVDITLHTPDGPVVYQDAFTYDAPEHELGTFVAMGASLTQGTQGGVPGQHAQLHSPSRWIAETTGAYHPIPLLAEPLFPEIGADDIGPPPACEVPDVPGHLAQAAIDVLNLLNDVEEDRIGFYLGRVDADIVPYNVAVGDTNVGDLIRGPDPDEFSQQFLAHLAIDPYGEVFDSVTVTQLELVEALQPDVVMITDTYGNDVIGSIVLAEDLDPDALTPVETVHDEIAELLQRLDATGAEVFVANLPRPTLLPLTAVRRQALIDDGVPEAEVNARLDAIEDAADGMRAALDTEAARYDRVHVVDLYSRVIEIDQTGLTVAGQSITVTKFGGVLSTDGVHFSDVGYAIVANEFISVMNDAMGTSIPAVDLELAIADDRHSPAALKSAGLAIADCQ